MTSTNTAVVSSATRSRSSRWCIAPAETAQIHVVTEIHALDAKLAGVAAEMPQSIFNPIIEKGMATHVDENASLVTAE